MGFVQNSFALTAAAVTSRSRLHLPEREKAKEKTKLKTKQRKPLSSLLYLWNYNHRLSHWPLLVYLWSSNCFQSELRSDPTVARESPSKTETQFRARGGGIISSWRIQQVSWLKLGFTRHRLLCLNTWYHLTRRISVCDFIPLIILSHVFAFTACSVSLKSFLVFRPYRIDSYHQSHPAFSNIFREKSIWGTENRPLILLYSILICD